MRAEMLWMRRGKAVADPVHGARKVQQAEKYEHKGDRELQSESEARRNYQPKQNDRSPNYQNRQSVANSPKDPDPPGARDRLLPADDGRDSDDMVGIGSVTHAEQEADAENEQGAGHEESSSSRSGSCKRMS